ncbi:hypothetical protein [Undibacterium sp. TS12]|nr:hypothetical protein [Undibacterium sp. TS12]
MARTLFSNQTDVATLNRASRGIYAADKLSASDGQTSFQGRPA